LVAIGAAVFTLGYSTMQRFPNAWIYAIIVFFLVLGTYNFHRLIKAPRTVNPSSWLVWVNSNRRYLWILSFTSFILGGALFVIYIPITLSMILLFSGVVFLSVWYVVPLVKIPLRDVPFIKTMVIALVWTTVMIGITTNEHIWPFFFGGLLFIYGITIPFDVRDIKYDESEKRTLPMLIGVRWSKGVAFCSVLLFYIIIAIFNQNIRINPFFWLSLIIYLLLIMYIDDKKDDRWCVLLDANLITLGLSFYMVSN